MYPHERSLVKKLADKPFALLGVNSDRDRKDLKKVLEKEEITWRSFWNGGSPEGPISTKWNLQGWPTLYVIDAKGVIRAKFLGGGPENEKKIDERIEEFLKAAGRPGRSDGSSK
jgi:hypothetical protein